MLKTLTAMTRLPNSSPPSRAPSQSKSNRHPKSQSLSHPSPQHSSPPSPSTLTSSLPLSISPPLSRSHRHSHSHPHSRSRSRSLSPSPPSFTRAIKYRPPPTSSAASAAANNEEFGSPRTSTQVKQAYLDSHPNSDEEDTSPTGHPTSKRKRSQQPIYYPVDHLDTPSTTSSPVLPYSLTHQTLAQLELLHSFHSEPSGMPSTTDPQHGFGSALSQGAALRAAAERETGPSPKRRTAALASLTHSAGSSPKDSPRNSTSARLHEPSRHPSPREAKDASMVDPAVSGRNDKAPGERAGEPAEKTAPSNAAAQGEALRRGEKQPVPTLESTRQARKRHEDIGRNSAPEPPLYPMSGIDNLALLMEDDSYQTVCFSIYMFKTVLDLETVRSFFHTLADTYPKYRYVAELDPALAAKKNKQRIKAERIAEAEGKSHVEELKYDPGRRTRYGKGLKAGSLLKPAMWRYVPSFNIEENITLVQCRDGGDDDELNQLAGKFLSKHFDYSKPIWEALLVHGLNTTDGGKSALMIKIHHCFSDGQGMIQSYHAALGALSSGTGIKDIQRKVDSSHEVKKPGQREIKPTVWGTVKHSVHTVRGLYFRSRKSFQSSGPRVSGRLYSHSEGIAMSDIKVIRQAFKGPKSNLTLNDVACAILARALRIAAERTSKDGQVKDKRVAIFVPISVRPKGDWSLSNATTGSIAWFRFEKEEDVDFEAQLAQVHREMNKVKRSYLPKLYYWTFTKACTRRITYLPNYPGWRQFYYRAFKEYHVATNVPGPPKPVKFGDHEAYSYHVLPPSSPGKATLAIGMISYANDFSLAVSCDDAPEFKDLANEICMAFQDAASQLVRAAKAKVGSEK